MMGDLVFLNNNRLVTDSLAIAESFGKSHFHVLRDVESLECSNEFRESNFGLSSYRSSQNKELPKYLITQDGFSFLVMGYTGKEASRFKELYISEFNRMRDELNKPKTFNLPSNMQEALRLAADVIEQNEKLEAANEQLAIENQAQQQKLKEQEAPVAIYNLAITAGNTLSMNEVAKSLNTGRTRLYKFLRDEKVIMQDSTLPFQRFIDGGYFKVTERPRASGDTVVNDPATRVTAKGFDYVAKHRTGRKPA